jgi:hypothetical protein
MRSAELLIAGGAGWAVTGLPLRSKLFGSRKGTESRGLCRDFEGEGDQRSIRHDVQSKGSLKGERTGASGSDAPQKLCQKILKKDWT